ncbi:DNA-binding protein [Asaia krungthepensis NRIC 0535]|uniref:DNA-binding protein n=2 Tax=Asaia krungthepensis TaxID=220990 RepID=A0ABQ0Q662_9PROT|nr:DNA-binding protein [Asaia krungthepensis NRIC 0535]
MVIDLVMEAPKRFSSAVRNALEDQLPMHQPVALRVRSHLCETATGEEIAAILARIRKRGSNGILLKAPDHSGIREEIAACRRAHIPVITLVTDLPGSDRLAYVGMDNQAAGGTAAWLMAGWMPAPLYQGKAVLAVISSYRFLGEEEREIGFRAVLRERAPHLGVVSLGEGGGLDWLSHDLIRSALMAHPEIEAVYSIGGGNRAVARAFASCGRRPVIFVAHDLDHDNRALLQDRTLTAVLHHDLAADMHQACALFIQANRLRSAPVTARPSPAHIITPMNMPPFT